MRGTEKGVSGACMIGASGGDWRGEEEPKRIGGRGPRRPDPIDQIIWAARLPKCHPGDVTVPGAYPHLFFAFFASPLSLLPDTVGLPAFPGLRSGKHHRPLAFLFLFLFILLITIYFFPVEVYLGGFLFGAGRWTRGGRGGAGRSVDCAGAQAAW